MSNQDVDPQLVFQSLQQQIADLALRNALLETLLKQQNEANETA